MSNAAAQFAARVRARERLVGYWVTLDAPPAVERLALAGYDYLCFDAQHGLFDYSGMLAGITAVDAASSPENPVVSLVRVGANDPYLIGRALDAGAAGVIVPLVDDADQAAAAVRASRYPPHGVRSFGPMRSGLRVGPGLAETDESIVVLAMIETAGGLANVEAICATEGLDGVYVGPSDLSIALGGADPGDPAVAEEFEEALTTIQQTAAAAGVTAGIHTFDGTGAAQRLGEGYTLATVSCDVVHLEIAAREHLAVARGH